MRVALLALVLVAGCATPRDPGATGPQARPSAPSYGATADSLEAAPSSLARLAVAARSFARQGLTPVAAPLLSTAESRFTLATADGPLAVGIVPGRDPLLRPELVLVGVDVESPQAPAVLEAARVLVERARWSNEPARSVEVVLWAGPSSRRRALGAPVWRAGSVHAVLEVMGEIWDEPLVDDGVNVVSGPPGLDLAGRVLARVLEVAGEPAITDSLAAQ